MSTYITPEGRRQVDAGHLTPNQRRALKRLARAHSQTEKPQLPAPPHSDWPPPDAETEEQAEQRRQQLRSRAAARSRARRTTAAPETA